jgi:omega-3 fatty acid desaturase (delta-15 desaturase)
MPDPNTQHPMTIGEDLPPWTLRDLRAVIPENCFHSSTVRSIGYLLLDVAALAALYAASVRLDSWLLWPVFALAQGTLFWALFVIGHDCGHGSFSRHRGLNHLVGHLVHAPLLVPYHGWRVSHRLHHRFAGNADRDEGWRPLSAEQVAALPWYTRLFRYRLTLLVFPLYLLRGAPWRGGSHFHPASPLFRASDRRQVLTSTLCCAGMLAALAGIGAEFGPAAVLKHYLGPYVVFVVWIDMVTLLHHTHPDVRWYREAEWTFLRGALSTVDRRHGWLDRIHHHAGLHLAHHLFPRIPHYRLPEATAALRRKLGERYRESREPLHRALPGALRCRVIDGGGRFARSPAGTGSP